MNLSEKASSHRKRPSVENDESLGPPLKLIRKISGMDALPSSFQGPSPVVIMKSVTDAAGKTTSKATSPVPFPAEEYSPMATPYTDNTFIKTSKEAIGEQPAIVTPSKSPPRGDSENEEDVIVERMELTKEQAGRLEDRDTLSRLNCQVDLVVEGRQGVITFRGKRNAVATAKAMISIILSQKSLVQMETSKTTQSHQSIRDGLATVVTSVNEFFHARTGPEACVLGGWMRIAYAFLFIMDRLLWSLDLDYFFYQSGVIPARVSRSYSYIEPDNMFTIFQLAPESDWLVWAINYLCLLQGILLLLGVAPHFQIACLVVYLASWEHLNDHVWDSQDVMLRMFGFLLCFMPLHRLTIYEWWQTRGMTKQEKKKLHKNDSWPMWPFRLWQIEVCFVYAGAGLSKLANKAWQKGHAVYYASFTNHFGGVFTPGFLFNRIGPLKAMSHGSLLVECLAWLTVWPLATRVPSILSMILLHVGIDLSMNMHIFEWLSILGWMSFFARPRVDNVNKSDNQDDSVSTDNDNESRASSRRFSRVLVNVLIALFIIVYGCETIPMYHIKQMTPAPLKPAVEALQTVMEAVTEVANPWEHRLGIHQETWSMFSKPTKKWERYFAFVTFRDGTKTEWHSPDWDGMSWLEKKRNRRRQLYFNNLMEFKLEGEGDVGQKHLCEWIAQQYDKEVERVKLVYHWLGAMAPAENLTWFDKIDRTNVNTWNETHYIHYTQEACNEWATEGECLTDAKFMLKRCAASCEGEFDKASDVQVGSRVLVWYKKDSAFYSASVLKIRENKEKRFHVKWDYSDFGKEWLDLTKHAFVILGSDKFVSSHKKTFPRGNTADKHNEKEEL